MQRDIVLSATLLPRRRYTLPRLAHLSAQNERVGSLIVVLPTDTPRNLDRGKRVEYMGFVRHINALPRLLG